MLLDHKAQIKNKLINVFKTFADFEKFVTKTRDYELMGKLKIVKIFHNTLPGHLKKIKSCLTNDESMAGKTIYPIYPTINKDI